MWASDLAAIPDDAPDYKAVTQYGPVPIAIPIIWKGQFSGPLGFIAQVELIPFLRRYIPATTRIVTFDNHYVVGHETNICRYGGSSRWNDARY